MGLVRGQVSSDAPAQPPASASWLRTGNAVPMIEAGRIFRARLGRRVFPPRADRRQFRSTGDGPGWRRGYRACALCLIRSMRSRSLPLNVAIVRSLIAHTLRRFQLWE